MEQLVSTVNQLILIIVNYIEFFIIYGTIFYFIGAVVYQIIHSFIRRFLPAWKNWYQSIRSKKH